MKASSLLPVLSALTMIAHAASAQSVIHYDFEDGSTAGWNIHSTTPSNPYLSVIDDPVRGASNRVMKVDATFGGLEMLRTALPEHLSTGTYELKFQIMVSGSNGGAASPQYQFDRRISFLDSTAVTSQTSTYIRYRRVTSYNEFNSYDGNGSGGGNWAGELPLVYDQWYEITQTINLDEKTWSWSLENLTTGGQNYTSETLGFFRNVPNISHLVFLNISGSGSGLFYLDEVEMKAIPEAGSSALVLAGGIVGLAGFAVRSLRKSGLTK